MDSHRKYSKKLNKKIHIRKYERDASTKNQEKEDQIMCGLALCSFEDKDDSGCSHYMTREKSKMESLMKNHHGNGTLGIDASKKFLGLGTL